METDVFQKAKGTFPLPDDVAPANAELGLGEVAETNNA